MSRSKTGLVSAAAIAAIALAAIWVGQGAENLCPAIYPAPASCSIEARARPALVGSVAVFALLALTIAVSSRDALAKLAVTLLGVAATVAPVWVFTSAGFIVDGTAAVIALCVVACITLTVVAVRRIGAEPSTSTV